MMNSTLPSHKISSICEDGILDIGQTLRQLSPFGQGIFIFLIVVNILACPFTAFLNILVILAVKTKSRLRAHKSNILLALTATTDLAVGTIIQPTLISLMIRFLVFTETTSGTCLLLLFNRIAMSYLCNASLIHLACISGERYLAIKRPFAHITYVTESRLQ